MTAARPIALGIRNNALQFTVLMIVNAMVGAMLGAERSLLPTLATETFGLEASAAVLSFIAVFGLSKAIANPLAGRLADRFGRRPTLIGGWLIAAPVPLLLMIGPSWGWILLANALLGLSQGITWSTTVNMKIDLAGPARRGLALGLNELAGYLALAGAALLSGLVADRFGLRPAPFALGFAYLAVGLGLSALVVRETAPFAALEATLRPAATDAPPRPSARAVLANGTFRDRTLSAASQAGLVNNLNDGVAWGLFPLIFTAAGLDLAAVGALAALYPAVWALAQTFTGALSDRIGRKRLIAAGMAAQSLGIAAVALGDALPHFIVGQVILGLGTAMVYPTLLAVIGDVAHPSWRASALGVYRMWRDLGYVVGAVLAGLIADRFGLAPALWVVAALTLSSGAVVALRMQAR